MNTRKLYYEDSHLRRFSAQVLACEQAETGFWIELDQTAFFPGGGGQACDLGTLGGAAVRDMKEDGETVLHLCAQALEPGSTVEGEIDWERRFDLMQQHSGEHILSGLINQKYGWHNVGFHMGADAVTIDFDGEIPETDLQGLEDRVNEGIWKDLELRIWTPSPEELPNVFYRTKRVLPWPVRIVQVPGYDSCACCGVHVRRTGEIGLLKILSCIRFRSGVRMEILCGKRALGYLSASHGQNKIVSKEFSAPVTETGAAAEKMNEQLSELKYQLVAMERQIFEGIAARCAGKGNVAVFREHLSPASVRTLAENLSAVCGGTAAVFAGTDAAGYSYCLGCRGGNLKAFVKEMNEKLQGRGGGKPEFQQGSLKADRKSILAFLGDFTETN